MQLPAIHLNGSDPLVLLAEYGAALEAIRKAKDALAAVTVNGRDYYTISSEAPSVAYKEHAARRKALADIEAELESVALHIAEQPRTLAMQRQSQS